jgi:hypothetical protein
MLDVLTENVALAQAALPVLLERDGHYPPDVVLDTELAAIASALHAGRRQAVSA